jgi:hypothetical protein
MIFEYNIIYKEWKHSHENTLYCFDTEPTMFLQVLWLTKHVNINMVNKNVVTILFIKDNL